MTAEEFTSAMLREVRRDFFQGASERQFFQEAEMLKEAICYPATWLNRKGAIATKYHQILRTVISAIKRKGNRDTVRRFNLYFYNASRST